ncbi:D-alanyl-D-alanine carboxypeptidase (penicillin-binding protein 5/6) [Sinobacterium caligoides]|uniref:serine-type D-Ala-D-Ala carboxypeptidase n=1 Tax=Sinobacterium caligoides TaxID=933926 RepID=A0A3N2DNH7_9GAMM|nr:D-alanyl-D-alanine carboxypeptidase family protein [Sinobacterium caligoides]ROS01366.1 D-alanyl-D-alanine carboxypeptidase (penicillin-binding protein 5/6) [Sinobacterium caligoides]
MLKLLSVCTLVCASVISSVAAVAAPSPSLIPAEPNLAAKSWVLMDADSGAVLAQKNADERLPPASLTKMMTSYVLSYEEAQGNVTKDDLVKVSRNAWASNPKFKGSSLMWIEVGKQVKLGDLHRGIIISSGNDASVAVAEYLAGSEDGFAQVMNKHAELLGMTNTHFVNSCGLPAEGHYSTAHDMARLAKGIIRDFPEDYEMYSEREFTYNGIRTPNRNKLLWRDPSVDGLKTGHTKEAGYCLVASAKRQDMRLIAAVMGTRSEEARVQETQKLLSYGFRYYETSTLYRAAEEVTTTRVWSGESDSVALGLKSDLVLTIARGQRKNLSVDMVIDDVIKAPFENGQELGRLVITLDGQELANEPLVALQAVEQSGFINRIWDSIVLFFRGIFS